MRRTPTLIAIVLVILGFPLAVAPLVAQDDPGSDAAAEQGSGRDGVTPLSRVPRDPPPELPPLAPAVKGERPKSDPSVLPPAATQLAPGLEDLVAPDPLALPVRPSQVRIEELRPLSLADVENLAEVNNPNLKAIGKQVDQAQSNLRAQLALWYPNINLNASSIPSYSVGDDFTRFVRVNTPSPTPANPFRVTTDQRPSNTSTSIWQMSAVLEASWALINPQRTPQIAAARDEFEKAKNQYLIALRELRLEAAVNYFDLQSADDRVRIGQESVRASLVSLRDARARFQAGVATKLEVLEAETQLARDQQLLTEGLAAQAIARRSLASILDLPQNVTPTAKDPSAVIGTWLPTLQESIVAAYAFREELDQVLLDISIANSNANASLGAVQPFLNIVNSFSGGRSTGNLRAEDRVSGNYTWNVQNTVGLTMNWNLFDGGRARAQYRQQKQRAEENTFLFAQNRDAIRREVETSFYELQRNNRNITTTSREVISSRESLRLARLRFQAGVTTQREVVDTQRDLTQAEVRYANAISDYNRQLAALRRRTGLDQVGTCAPPSLPPERPGAESLVRVPVEPQPLLPACEASLPSTPDRIPGSRNP